MFEGVEWTGVARLAQQTGGLVDVLAKHGVLADKKYAWQLWFRGMSALPFPAARITSSASMRLR